MATEVTDEMIRAFHVAWHKANAAADAPRRAGIAAVLAIVDRDNREITRQAYERGQRDERALKEMGF